MKKLKAVLPNKTLTRFVESAGINVIPPQVVDGLFEEMGDSLEAVRGFFIAMSATVSQLQGMLDAAHEQTDPFVCEVIEVPVLHFMRLYVGMANQPQVLVFLQQEADNECTP